VNPILPQMGAAEIDGDQAVVSEPIGNYPSMPSTNEPSAMTIGEKFVSVRQLMLRYTKLAWSGTAETFGGNVSFSLYPYFVGLPEASGRPTNFPSFSMDALSRLAHGYAFMRGSLRIMVVTPGGTSTTNGHKMWNVPAYCLDSSAEVFNNNVDTAAMTGTTYQITSTSFGTSHTNAYVVFDATNINPSARVPYYCENHSTAILPNQGSNLIPKNVWDPNTTLIYQSQSAATGSVIEISRSIGEDFQLGYFLGFPPVYGPTA